MVGGDIKTENQEVNISNPHILTSFEAIRHK